MIPEDAVERAAATGLHVTGRHLPDGAVTDAILLVASSLPDLEWRLKGDTAVGDRHPVSGGHGSMRVTVRQEFGRMTIIAIADGGTILHARFSERIVGGLGIPTQWADPADEVGTILSLTVLMLRHSGSRAEPDSARRWTIGAATAAALASGVEMHGTMAATMPSPFSDGMVEGGFFSQLPGEARRRAYSVLETIRDASPCMVGVKYDRDDPTRMEFGPVTIREKVPDGVVERIRALTVLRAMLPQAVVLDV